MPPLVDNQSLRPLFSEYGRPGLGQSARRHVAPVTQIRQVIDEALHGTPELPRARLLALALCWHDHWDESHAVCQAHEGDQDSDLIHMVLHRREQDAANCQYWIAHTGWHPVYECLSVEAQALGLAGLAPAGRWSPERFLERCLAATEVDRPALERLQEVELLGACRR